MIVPCTNCQTANRVPAARIASRAHCGKCKAPLCPPEEPLPIQSDAEFDELVRHAPVPVLVDFWAEWCGPCRMVAPELQELARSRGGRVVVAKVDTEALPTLAGRFSIRSIPTMIVFRGGRETQRLSGAMPAQQIAENLGL